MRYPGHEPHFLSASCRRLWLIALPVLCSAFPELIVQSASSWLPVLFRLCLERGVRLQGQQQSAPSHTTLTTPKLHISVKGALPRFPGKKALVMAGLELAPAATRSPA